MTHSIENIRHWPEGDTRIFPFVVTDRDSDGERLNLSGSDISWRLFNNVSNENVLSLDDAGVSIEMTDEMNGEFEIHVDKEATEELSGDFREIIRITDAEGNRSTWKAKVRISKVE